MRNAEPRATAAGEPALDFAELIARVTRTRKRSRECYRAWLTFNLRTDGDGASDGRSLK
jgi:hypothetical protein